MILVTGASERFSPAVLAGLCTHGIPAVGDSRTPSSGQRNVDFNAPDSLDFNGADTLLLVSTGTQEGDRQIAFNHVAVEVAEHDGVSRIVYTSPTGTGDHLSIALPHRVTERMIMASGMTWTILHNGVYTEILDVPLLCEKRGEALRIVSPLGNGAVAAVARHNLAYATTSVLGDLDKHGRKVYELVGSRAVSAAGVAARLGCEARDISLDDCWQLLAEDGMLSFHQSLMLSIASVIRHGLLAGADGGLPYLLGRESTNPLVVAAKALAARRVVVP